MVPGEELSRRVGRLREKLAEAGMAGALVVQRADLYYFSGTGQDAHLFVPAGPGCGEPLLMVKKNLERARRESALPQVVPYEGFKEMAAAIRERLPGGGFLGMELDVLPAALCLRYQAAFAPFEIADASPLIREIRSVKSAWEIDRQKEAAALSREMFAYARQILRPGMTELELAARLEAFVRERGHQGAVRMRSFNQELFYGHIMAGSRAAAASFFDGPTGGGPGTNPSYPQGASHAAIGAGEPVLVDFVTVREGYMVDQTRVFCLGPFPEELRRAYETALAVKSELAALGKAGFNARLLYERAVEMAEEAGLGGHFMGCGHRVGFIGHGVGLELDELPVLARGLDRTLEEGAVFALEPKFVFPGAGVAGIEDTFVVRPGRLEQLTSFDEEAAALCL